MIPRFLRPEVWPYASVEIVREKCECGEDAIKLFDEGEEYGRLLARFTPVCAACFTKKDSAEPSDPDGEDMFRDFRAEERDALDAARELK